MGRIFISSCKSRDGWRNAGYTGDVNGSPPTTPDAHAPAGDAASTPPSHSASPSPQSPTIPDHTLLRGIGAGGYGEVWLARSALGTLRAVKIVQRAAFDDDRPYEREFAGLQKFEPLSRTHEGFVDLLQVGRNDAEGWFYYVMELADPTEPVGVHPCSVFSNQSPTPSVPAPRCSPPNTDPLIREYTPLTLSSSVKLRGAFPLDGCLRIARTLAGALAELHRHGLVHRDIKPSNIIVVGGVPKLADVGLVASAKGVGQDRSFVGTEGFIPPEGPGTPSADLYSLGIVFYVMSTGKSHRDYPEPPDGLATRPDGERQRWLEFSAVIHRAATADPKRRYASAKDMLSDLDRLDAGRSVRRRRAYLRLARWTAAAAVAVISVFGALRIVGSARSRTLAEPHMGWTTHREAAQAYELGEFFLGKMATPETLANARGYLETALRLDPDFAQAYCALAFAYNQEPGWGTQLGQDAFPKAKALAQRAVDLAPRLSWAHSQMCWSHARFDYDWQAAEQAALKALELGPGYPGPHLGYALQVLLPQGRFDEALKHAQKAVEIGPTDHFGPANVGMILYYQRRSEEALAYYEQAAHLEPKADPHRLYRARTVEEIPGRRADAVREYQAFLADAPGAKHVEATAGLAYALARGGETTEARVLLAELSAHSDETRAAVSLAWVHTALGEPEAAIGWLEKGYVRRDPWMIWIKVDPRLEPLRDHPGFLKLLSRMNLMP